MLGCLLCVLIRSQESALQQRVLEVWPLDHQCHLPTPNDWPHPRAAKSNSGGWARCSEFEQALWVIPVPAGTENPLAYTQPISLCSNCGKCGRTGLRFLRVICSEHGSSASRAHAVIRSRRCAMKHYPFLLFYEALASSLT